MTSITGKRWGIQAGATGMSCLTSSSPRITAGQGTGRQVVTLFGCYVFFIFFSYIYLLFSLFFSDISSLLFYVFFSTVLIPPFSFSVFFFVLFYLTLPSHLFDNLDEVGLYRDI